ncbi:unnamed protein product [Psylliodes chrysocephalus]|uniref:Plexin domain-containing protein 2 n=1 Tax=Psylliodes chrysocephalus TaxID=3402493 RepID=A0A9P0GB97_9CUCU|nr:unnamed protein product [Psylliodes chrysocephala]
MAKCYFSCLTFIVFLFISFKISACLRQIDLNLYAINEDHQSSDYSLVFNFLDNEDLRHDIEKRDISNTTVHNSTSVPYNTAKQPSSTQTTKKIVAVPLQKTISNVSIPLLQKNLGENGTGIRKDLTAKTPPLLHNITVPISTNTNVNPSTTVNTNVKPINNVEDLGGFGDPDDLDTEDGEKRFNETLTEHNVTSTKTDPNLFYNTSIYSVPNIGHFYWVNMTNRTDVKISDLLSHSHRRAATVKLSFDFPFYGHLIKNVTIATGGFLYTGDYVHSWLAATQYIAPLMANFDTSLSNDSFIKYVDNGTAFTVEWEKVTLQDKPEDGEFTFQVTLFKNGDIVFVYESIPLLVDHIQELHHPVKVGLSDAYIMDQFVFLIRRKTIYEYDRVNFNKTFIKNWTTIVLKALPTCLDAHDCDSCLSRNLKFQCFWCPAMGKCSQGFDRHRQNWLAHGCDKTSFSNLTHCSASSALHTEEYSNFLDHNLVEDQPKALAGMVDATSMKQDGGFSGLLAILFLIGMISGLTLWVFYAYRNPHTTSGQILIRYRPSQWRWRRGEARYTAATIHM